MNRRDFSKSVVSTVGVLHIANGSAWAQVGGGAAARCPDGYEAKFIKYKTESAVQERSISFLGGLYSATQKVPVLLVNYELTCEKKPPPPPPPKNVLESVQDIDISWLSKDLVVGSSASDYLVTFNLVGGVGEFVGDVVQFEIDGNLASGKTVSANFEMRRTGNIARFAAPNLVDFWLSTTGSTLVSGRFGVGGISVKASAYGIGRLGTTCLIGGYAVAGFSSKLLVAQNAKQLRELFAAPVTF